MFDLLIKHATVADGTGEPSFVADVAVKNGKILEVEPRIRSGASNVVDAEGLVLTPGFVDIQNHSDAYWCLFDSPQLESMILQGFTTVLVGNSGTSLAPLLSRHAIRSSQKWHALDGSNINWTTFKDFVSVMSNQKLGCNVASLVGYSTLRRGIVGDDRRPLSVEEAMVVQQAAADSITAGAFGVSAGLTYAHEASVSELELFELAKVARYFRALFSVTLRNEASQIVESVLEALEVARKSGARLKISHLQVRGKSNWELRSQVMDHLETAVHQGVEVMFDVFPYASVWQPLYTYLPSWASAGGRSAMLKTLANATQRKKVLTALSSHHSDLNELIVASTTYQMRVIAKTLRQVAHELGASPEEAAVMLLEHGGAEVLVFDPCLNAEHVEEWLAHPLSVVASNGAGFPGSHRGRHIDKLVHPRCFGSSARFISLMRHSKRLSLEAAIAKLTSMPAQWIGLSGRGYIVPGAAADLVLMDPIHITDHATLQNPYRPPTGIHRVWVNGAAVVKDGVVTGEMPGEFLRRS